MISGLIFTIDEDVVEIDDGKDIQLLGKDLVDEILEIT